MQENERKRGERRKYEAIKKESEATNTKMLIKGEEKRETKEMTPENSYRKRR